MAEGSLTRRSLITGAVAVVAGGIAGFVVARQSSLAHATSPATGGNGYTSYGSGPSHAQGGGPLVAVSKVPAGGGVVLADDGVVVTKAQDGTVQGFSSTCTHQGCTLGSVQGGTINCPCHGSKFNAFTGAVVNGPATQPLPAVSLVVRGGSVYRA
jgi:Rieske Fe-S protein